MVVVMNGVLNIMLRFLHTLGPYDNTDELNRMKGELAKRGFDVAVIKF